MSETASSASIRKNTGALSHSNLTGLIPAAVTSLGLLIGFYSLVFAINGHYGWAALMTEIAVVFDWMDGFIARALHTASPIGVEYDSLSDVTASVSRQRLSSTSGRSGRSVPGARQFAAYT